MTPKRIAVIIDDNGEFLEMIQSVAFRKKTTQTIRYFVSPLEALTYIESNYQHIDAVFTDYHMNNRKVDGGVVIAKCRRFSLPVYLVTGDTIVAGEYSEAGFTDGSVERTEATTEIFEILKTINEAKKAQAA